MLHALDFALMVSLNREMQRKTRTSTTKRAGVGGEHKEIARQTSNKVRNRGSGTYQHRIIQQDLLHKNK